MVEEMETRQNVPTERMEERIDEDDAAMDTDEEGGLKVDNDIYIPPPPKSINKVDINGPRLMITKIVNVNFKSYCGTQVIGPFHKCFSAIIGPNGSGKSNIIDSMLFVFGYRASKIRSKTLSVLIHNSDKHQNINSCTVSVHFQQIIDKPGADYDVVPNSEFIISRTAFKDNSSYYQFNKKKTLFKEISRTLKSYGVDLTHNRFLILQGEVEQIAMMKPKAQNEHDFGMLEFLEDIIGTVRYKEPLQKLSEKVEDLTNYRVEKLNRYRIVEKEKAALEEPMQEAVQYLRLENTITKIQHQLYHCNRFETMKEVSEFESKKTEMDKDLSDLMNKLKEIQNEEKQKNNIIAEKNKKWDSLQQQKDELLAKFDKVRKQDESLHAELVATNKRRKANIATLKTEKAKIEELRQVPGKNMRDIEECEQQLETYIKNQAKLKEELETLVDGVREKVEPLLKERSKFEKELMSLRKDVDEAQATFNIAQSELELYTSVECREKETLEMFKNSLNSTVNNLKEKKQQLESIEIKISNNQQNLAKVQQEFETVKSREIEMTSKLKKMRISFEEQQSAMRANKSRNKILDSLMREKREGRITGIYGRLGDLGAIDGKYNIAISTACGPLDNIVVDTVATAQACITFLRQNDIGRATFIPLEKQQHLLSRCAQKIQTPENVPRLFDLIRVEDERVLPAFYYGLHNTLAADNLQQATRIAYGNKRFRVVTLKGELIELSGTMSGGGRSVMRDRMGQKVVTNELSVVDIERLQSDLDKTYEECNQLRVKYQSLESQIFTLNTNLKGMEVERDKLHNQVKTSQEQESSLRMQLKIQEKKVANSVSDPKKVKELTARKNAAEKSLEKVKENSESIEKNVARINVEIEAMSGNRVKDQQKKISNLCKSIDTIKAEICKLQVAIKTAERNVLKIEKNIDRLENDVHDGEQRLRDIQKEKQKCEEEAKELLNEVNKLSDDLSERDEILPALKEELNALRDRENKIKAIKIDLDQKLVKSNCTIKGLKQQILDYTKKIAQLKLQPIPDENPEELKELTEEELLELDKKTISINLEKAQKKLPSEIPSMQLIAEYREKNALCLKRAADLEEITNERNRIRDIYETARCRRIQEFLAGFTVITDKLKEMYQMITLGGDAELELVDSLDPFSEGIAFSVRPPKKSWKNICNLSGGEKTLSSLALIFALHHYKPTPLYFMDEIDAALDFKNVSIIGNYIKERTKNAQFIIISLRSNMFELADYLVGIYKTYNCTKSAIVDLRKYIGNPGISQSTQMTSKNIYPSQLQKFCIQSRNEDRCVTQTMDNVQIADKNQETNENTLLPLIDLHLCPTPTKSSVQNKRSEKNNIIDSGEENIDKQPTRKKRRISNIEANT
ncbi:structural maintenance of chromosomes 4-like protein gluon isoform X1 [Colletes latitarsis]|uniref:structural maintenance of chromosomes 4-like protein gluon isoform X1 n=2 Tax=Colletes latitarsis TaxID=2605962 RepID=UPI0040368848